MRRGQKTSAEQVVLKLRQIEVQTAQGKSLALACKERRSPSRAITAGARSTAGLQVDQARKMKDLVRENARLRRLVADLSLEKQVLEDVASETCSPRAARQAVDGIREKYGLSDVTPAGSTSAPRHATLRADRAGRRGWTDPSHRCLGLRLRTLWLSPRHRAAAGSGGWQGGQDRVQRIWRREGMKVRRSTGRAAGFG